MAEKKRYLDLVGLTEYDRLIKLYINKGINGLTSGDIKDLKDAVNKLNGADTVEGSVKKQIKDAINAIVDGAPAAYDTLKEIADWIANDETGTAALIGRVGTLETTVGEAAKPKVDEESHEATQEDVDAGKATAVGEKVIDVKAEEAKPATGLVAKVGALEEAIGENGSVATQIANAIDGLDATVTNKVTDATTLNDVDVTVVETNGKLTSVSAELNFERITEAQIQGLFAGSLTDAEITPEPEEEPEAGEGE